MDKKALVQIASEKKIPKEILQHFAEVAIRDAMPVFEEDFDESKINRAANGQFASKSEGGSKSDSSSQYKTGSNPYSFRKFGGSQYQGNGENEYQATQKAHASRKKDNKKQQNTSAAQKTRNINSALDDANEDATMDCLDDMDENQCVSFTDANGNKHNFSRGQNGLGWHDSVTGRGFKNTRQLAKAMQGSTNAKIGKPSAPKKKNDPTNKKMQKWAKEISKSLQKENEEQGFSFGGSKKPTYILPQKEPKYYR